MSHQIAQGSCSDTGQDEDPDEAAPAATAGKRKENPAIRGGRGGGRRATRSKGIRDAAASVHQSTQSE